MFGGVPKETLNSDQVASSRQSLTPRPWSTKALGGPGAGLRPGGRRLRIARRYLTTATYQRPRPRRPPPLRMGVHAPAGMYAAISEWANRQLISHPMSGRRAGRLATAACQPARQGSEVGERSGVARKAVVAAYKLPRLFRRGPRRPERLPSGSTIFTGCRPSKRPSRLPPREKDATTL